MTIAEMMGWVMWWVEELDLKIVFLAALITTVVAGFFSKFFGGGRQ